MKLSEILFSSAEALWQEATEKDFVVQMAKGTLAIERYRHYMLQDDRYLADYIRLLKKMSALSATSEWRGFIDRVIVQTEEEAERVHLPHMRKIGITEAEIQGCNMESVLKEYVSYMASCLEADGFLAGVTALLQCSWVYAYIGEALSKRFSGELRRSPYRDWFAAYTSSGYVLANQAWIDRVDQECVGLDAKKASRLCEIFQACARYENRFWDVL